MQLDENVNKLCKKCGVIKPRTHEYFEKRSKSSDGLLSKCRECCRVYRKTNLHKRVESNRRYRAKYPEKLKEKHRLGSIKAYGLTELDYNQILSLQKNKCAICGTETPGGFNGRFHIDHCHKTGKIRGLLCHHCNKGIGQLKDDVIILQNAIAYITMANTGFIAKNFNSAKKKAIKQYKDQTDGK